MTKFNVLNWDFNTDSLVYYDVLPYFRNEYKKRKTEIKKKSIQKALAENPDMNKYYGVPKSQKEMKEFVENESRYQFWGRCQYEMVCHGWPRWNNEHKLDVHEQIMMNIDIIVNILMSELK